MKQSIVLKIAYEGTEFFGWQKTDEGSSIEGALEEALHSILGEVPLLQAASRTDRGVHAAGQIVQFQTEKKVELKKLQLGLNALLPHAIRVMNVAFCSSDFHPTLDTSGKEYRYVLNLGAAYHPVFRHMAWHVPKFHFSNDVLAAIPHLVGTHDFKAFCNSRKNLSYTSTVRTVESITYEEKDGLLVFIFKGDHFLYKMVRNLMGLLVQIGEKKFSKEAIPDLFKNGIRKEGAMTAPAHGLSLHSVSYPFPLNWLTL